MVRNQREGDVGARNRLPETDCAGGEAECQILRWEGGGGEGDDCRADGTREGEYSKECGERLETAAEGVTELAEWEDDHLHHDQWRQWRQSGKMIHPWTQW